MDALWKAARRRASREGGFTAVELVVTLGVAAVLVGMAVPGFASLRRSAGVSSAANELVWALHLARTSAVTRGRPVTVCVSGDGERCLASAAGDAGSGWLVFQTAGQAVVPQPGAAAELLHRFALPPSVSIHATRPAVTFWPVARAASTSTFELCDVDERTAGRAVIVSQTGRPRVAPEAASCAG